jgi:putative ABC transport system permease protein
MIFILRWIKGIVANRPERLIGAIVGVALTITLFASLGTFLASSSATMTERAISDVPVDWQILLTSAADQKKVQDALGKTTPYTILEKVMYADVEGFTATTGGTVQTTGKGKVLGISSTYMHNYTRMIRQLTGKKEGVLVAQQTAANLHVKEGDVVTIKRTGMSPVQIKVDGVIDLPYADSLFQAIGVPKGTAPIAPPDNVLLIPEKQWHTLFDPQSKARPDTVRMQFHVRIDHKLPANPSDAYTYVTHLSNNLEARIAGSGIVGNNLAARLSAVRADALYARVLFLFLGLPGVILAIFLTFSIVNSGKKHLLQEQALLRTRGASITQVLNFEVWEALIITAGGIVLGVVLTFLTGRFLAGIPMVINGVTLLWITVSVGAGVILAMGSVMYLAFKQARYFTVASSRSLVRVTGTPLWRKIYLDFILLALSFFVYWHTASTGYQVVLAPEGVPQISVHYGAFFAPFCLWLGGVLLAIRLWDYSLKKGRRAFSRMLRPVARNLSGIVAASLGRQRVLLTRGVILVALAISFAVSTGIFNTTYNAQSRVDAELTNGSDVTVKGTTAAPPGSVLTKIKTVPGIASVQPMIHRFAYVGTDLQDIYGIDPGHIGEATKMSDAYFAGGNAKATLNILSQHPDGVLVSEETRRDYQLHQGDLLKLRLQFASDHQYHIVPFRFIGVVREFTTAPRDSFLVANASYIAQKTGTDAKEIVLIRAKSNTTPAELAKRVEKVVSSLPGAKVTDIGSAQKIISSNLTAINLHGLTRLELFFAVLLVMGSTGLILALGLNERRRNFAILDALGAKSRQLGAFIWSEGLLMLGGGVVIGMLLGFGVAHILVKVLKGVFDPPPEHLVVPWVYLVVLVGAASVSTIIAVSGMKRISHRPVVEELRKL